MFDGLTTTNNGQKDVTSLLRTSEEDMFAVTADNMNLVIEDGWLAEEDIYKNVGQSE